MPWGRTGSFPEEMMLEPGYKRCIRMILVKTGDANCHEGEGGG